MIKTSYLNNEFKLSLAIGCKGYLDDPEFRVYIVYSGYDWDEIRGEVILTITDLESGNEVEDYVFGRSKLRFKSGTLLHDTGVEEITQFISEGSDISIHFILKGKRQKIESNWEGKSSFNKVLNELNQSC